MKYGQFAEVSGTNDDLEDLNDFSNLAYYDSKWWFVSGVITDVDTYTMYVKSVSTLTGSTTTERTVAWTTGNTAKSTGDMNIEGFSIYINDNDIYASMGITYLRDDDTNYYVEASATYTTDGGSGWTDNERYIAFTQTATIENKAALLRLIEVDSGIWMHLAVELPVTAKSYAAFVQVDGGGEVSNDDVKGWDYQHQGCIVSGSYYFVYQDDADDVKLYAFNGTTITAQETLTTVYPVSRNPEVQLYWRQKTQEFLIDEDHFYYRTVGDTTWSSVSDTGTTTNGIIWGYDRDGNYQIRFIIWKDSIYKVFGGGGIAKIQTYTGNAYVGWDDWFANGADKIYQLDP